MLKPKHDPEKWESLFGKRSCSNQELERDDDARKSHPTPGANVTLRDPDHIPPGPGEPLARPLATAAIVIYATLALLAIAVPRGLVNWTKNFEPSAPREITLRVAETIQTLSHCIGADWLYAKARAEFLTLTGKRDD
jgi:hypothetical protein